MPRRKSAVNCAMLPWLSARHDGREGRFIQVGNTFMLSDVVQELSAGARWLLLSMAMESGGKREFLFPRSAAKKYGIAKSSFERQVSELKEAGFIELLEDNDRSQYAPNRFRFCFTWKGDRDKPASKKV